MAILKPFRQVQNIKRKDLNYDLVDHIWIDNYFTGRRGRKNQEPLERRFNNCCPGK